MEASQTQFIREALAATPQTMFTLEEIQTRPLFKAVGCDACDQGYKGRIGIFQVMPISDALQTLILGNSDGQALSAQTAREGIRNLRQAGWLKVLQGLTSAQEVMASTHHG
jgi:type IV pilus assembly protein PilB